MSPREPALSPVNAGCPGICPVVPCREAALSAGKEKKNDTKKEKKYTTKAIKPYKIPESNPSSGTSNSVKTVTQQKLTGGAWSSNPEVKALY